MSTPHAIPREFKEWIVQSLDGTISPDQFERFDRELRINPRARSYYFEFISTYVGLADQVGALPHLAQEEKGVLADGSESRLNVLPPISANPGLVEGRDASDAEDRIQQIEAYAREQLDSFLTEQHQQVLTKPAQPAWTLFEAMERFVLGIRTMFRISVNVIKATAVLAVLGLLVLMVSLYLWENRTLATLDSSVAARWRDVQPQTGGFLRRGRLSLEEGYAHLTFASGAEVILQAPSTLELQSEQAMYLERGWITVTVPEQAAGFTVETPGSRVVDYGTEFGLMVGQGSHSELHVFVGSVGIAGAAKPEERLSGGQAVSVDGRGQFERFQLDERPRLFTRQMPRSQGLGLPGKRLNLADIVGGGNGLNTGLPGTAIDPVTGLSGPSLWKAQWGRSDYVPVPHLPLVDGVFIPCDPNHQIVTSAGHVFRECPETTPAWHTGVTNGRSSRDRHPLMLDGRACGTAQRPCILLHANLGVTFDLRALRQGTPGVTPAAFKARIGVSEGAQDRWSTSCFWVLVDGEVRFQQVAERHKGPVGEVDVTLNSQDRFLTLVATDGQDYEKDSRRAVPGDWCLFVDPVIELVTRGAAKLGHASVESQVQ